MDHNNSLSDYIKNHMTSLSSGKVLPIRAKEAEGAFIINLEGKVGVAVPYESTQPFFAKFTTAEMMTKVFYMNQRKCPLLFLYIPEKYRRQIVNESEFSVVCADFVSGAQRESLQKNPLDWWTRWSKLMGNENRKKQIVSLFGELISWRWLLQHGYQPQWGGANRTRIDFEDKTALFDVKTTLTNQSLEIVIHGQNQLYRPDNDVPMYILFVRLEKNPSGESINEVIEDIVTLGIDKIGLEEELTKLDCRLGDAIRENRYSIIELRKYKVDENFPALTPEKFKGNKIPDGIIRINYTIDLANIPYENVFIA